MNKYLPILLCLVALKLFGQSTDTLPTQRLQGVTVSAYREKPVSETPFLAVLLQIDSLSRYGNYNLTDLLAKTPGVSMLSTGAAISKPVIRGLYGNRVLVLLSGLKFDNQQWQEEHGLGLSDLGLSTVELIKGPVSVLYGSEAMGGIINLIEEQKSQTGERETDFSVKLHTNTLGGLVQGGYNVNRGKNWFRIRLGIENNADYTDGNKQRVLNSRFDGYYLKSTYGFQHKNWVSTNTFSSSFNRFGFIFQDIYDFVQPDGRWSRNLQDNPAHLVLLNVLSSENKVYLRGGSKLSVNAGVQSNKRLENEGGGAISLDMHLLTAQYLVKWEKQIKEKHKIILSNLSSFEDNTNYGARKIVPDARMQESNLSVYVETRLWKHLVWENGLGAGEKWIKTFFTPAVNGPEKEIQPFTKFSPYYNASSGLSFFPDNGLNVKVNLATGVRIPNLAELSSDGLHEGIFTYEIGSPELKNEQNICANFYAGYAGKQIEVYFSPFYNYFVNYVYLAPTAEQWFGFPVYRYRQQDAAQYGTELSVTLRPIAHLQISASYAGMISQTRDGQYTPFVPAQKISPGIQYTLAVGKINPVRIFTNADYCFAQDKVYPNEVTTPQYFLWNAGISATFHIKNTTYDWGLAASNLLNTAYYDHLSRFKYFGLLNMGRNFTLTLRIKHDTPIRER